MNVGLQPLFSFITCMVVSAHVPEEAKAVLDPLQLESEEGSHLM